MKRLSVFVLFMALSLLPISSARAAPGGVSVGCGPAGDVAKPTGLALIETTDPVEKDAAAPALVDQPVQDKGVDVHLTDHDVLLILGTTLVVLLLIILL